MRTLLTGGTGKLGAAVAERLRGEGWQVLAAGSRDGDLSRADEARALVERAVDELGGLDVVINGAAAGFDAKPFEQVTEADVDAALGATVKGSFFVTQAAMPHLRESRGLVVMIEDVAAYQPWPVVRGARRGQGSAGDADADAREGARPRVRVCGIAPGPVALEPGDDRGAACRRDRAAAGRLARRRRGGDPLSRGRRTSSPARRSPSTEAGCCKPGRPAMRRPNAWMRQ